MKILLDECVPVQVRQALPDHEVHSATNPPWRGLSNGELLGLAEQQGFELLVIADKNMRHQQDISSRRIDVLELWTNHRPTLERKSNISVPQPNEWQRVNISSWPHPPFPSIHRPKRKAHVS